MNKEDVDPFEAIIEDVKHAKGVKLDNELEVEDLKELVKKFKAAVKEQTGKDFPTCATSSCGVPFVPYSTPG